MSEIRRTQDWDENCRRGAVVIWEYRGPHARLWNILEGFGKTNKGDSQYANEIRASEEGDKCQYEPQYVNDPQYNTEMATPHVKEKLVLVSKNRMACANIRCRIHNLKSMNCRK